MAYSKAKLKSNGDKASPFFKAFIVGNKSDKFLLCRTLLYVSFRHNFISLTSFMAVPYSNRGGTVVKVLCYKSGGRWFDPS